MEKFLINLCIGIVVVIGFLYYWGKNSNTFEEGGIMYELLDSLKSKRKSKKNIKNKEKQAKKNIKK